MERLVLCNTLCYWFITSCAVFTHPDDVETVEGPYSHEFVQLNAITMIEWFVFGLVLSFRLQRSSALSSNVMTPPL